MQVLIRMQALACLVVLCMAASSSSSQAPLASAVVADGALSDEGPNRGGSPPRALGEPSGQSFTLVPDFGHVYLRSDHRAGVQILGHTVLHDEVSMRSSGWRLECAEDGFAFLFQDEGAGSHDEDRLVQWVTELLPRSLCERGSANDGGGLYVLEQGGDSPGRCTELASLQNVGVECEAKLRPSQVCAHLVCKCEIFRLPRAGFRLWWQLQGLFTMCGFTNAAGRSGSWWVHRYWKVWKTWLTDLSMGDSLRKCGEPAAEGGLRGEAPELREVRWPSASAPGLVALLSRLSFAPRHSGGLKAEGDRAACRQVLTTLTGSVIDQEWVWEVFMGDDGLQWDPPRPMQGSGRLLVPVGADGIADILAMCSHLAPQRAIFVQRMVAQYCHSEDIARVTLVDFLAALQTCAPGRGITRVAAD